MHIETARALKSKCLEFIWWHSLNPTGRIYPLSVICFAAETLMCVATKAAWTPHRGIYIINRKWLLYLSKIQNIILILRHLAPRVSDKGPWTRMY